MKSVASLGAVLMLAACPGERAVPDGGSAPLAADDAAYLVQLGLIRGHLRVGHELLRAGHGAAAATHSKHPSDELYAGLEEAFPARGAAGFAAALSDLAAAFESGDRDHAARAHEAVEAAIAEAEAVVDHEPALVADVILGLLRTAAWEYAVGIANGAVANAHEYQDAWGFTRTARDWAGTLGAGDGAAAAVFARIRARLGELDDLWPELAPSEVTPAMAAARLYGAAAEVEIMALDLARRE